jgi:predicted nuclease of predicted toxin-antitoxin system
MPRCLVDEALPGRLAKLLTEAGIPAVHVRDVGLRGKSDDEVFAYAQAQGMALVTLDTDFGNILHFPTEAHRGIFVARFPDRISIATIMRSIVDCIRSISDEEVEKTLIIIEPGAIRFHRKR